jgi:FixJ family two-component response regulator
VPSDTRISVVDDDAAVREAVRSLLRSAGYRADTFASAEEALDNGGLEGAACVVLDVRMPGMSGLELQDRLIASGRLIPIVFVTAHADEQARARALERGAVACLQKPFDGEALLDAVAKAVGAASGV